MFFKILLVLIKNLNIPDEKRILAVLMIFFYFLFLQIYYRIYSKQLFRFLDLFSKIFIISCYYFLIWVDLSQESNLEILFFFIEISLLIVFLSIIFSSFGNNIISKMGNLISSIFKKKIKIRVVKN